MKEVGYLSFIDSDEELNIYSDDFINFYDRNDKILNGEEELKNWAIWLNSPWSYDCFKYMIFLDSEKKWQCDYVVFGYDCVQSGIFSFGDTPQEALTNCQNNFKKLQEKYNPDNISI